MKKTLLSLSLTTALFTSLLNLMPINDASASAEVTAAADEETARSKRCTILDAYLAELGALKNFLMENNLTPGDQPRVVFHGTDSRPFQYDPTLQTITFTAKGGAKYAIPETDAQKELLDFANKIDGFRRDFLDAYFKIKEEDLLNRIYMYLIDHVYPDKNTTRVLGILPGNRLVPVEIYLDAFMPYQLQEELTVFVQKVTANKPPLQNDYDPERDEIMKFVAHFVLGRTATQTEVSRAPSMRPVEYAAFEAIMKGVLMPNQNDLDLTATSQNPATHGIQNALFRNAMKATVIDVSREFQNFLTNPSAYKTKAQEITQALQATKEKIFNPIGAGKPERASSAFMQDYQTALSKVSGDTDEARAAAASAADVPAADAGTTAALATAATDSVA